MLTLVAIGFAAGLVTALSPCVLPVLPGILAASSLTAGAAVVGGPGPGTGPVSVAAAPQVSRRRPYLIVAGLLTSFTLLTLLGATLISVLGVPEGLLRGPIALLTIIGVGLGLLIPGIGHQLEKLFYRFPNRGPVRGSSAFVFGLTLGVVFVPCAGPVLAAITVLAASQGLSAGLVVLTLAFAAGLWRSPLLLVARLGVGAGRRLASRMPTVRRVAGAVLLLTGLAMAFGLADAVQRAVPGYVAAVQQRLEDNDTARGALDALRSDPRPAAAAGAPVGEQTFDECAQNSAVLADCGRAPELTGIVDWLNTPGDAPLSLAGLQAEGRVVLVDFWTYSCINCQRTLPSHHRLGCGLPRPGPDRHRGALPGVRLRARGGQRRRAGEGLRRRVPDRDRQRLPGPGAPTDSATGRPTTSSIAREPSARSTTAKGHTRRPRR